MFGIGVLEEYEVPHLEWKRWGLGFALLVCEGGRPVWRLELLGPLVTLLFFFFFAKMIM
jgi:hypothetical protein